jgi:hypothetical protein
MQRAAHGHSRRYEIAHPPHGQAAFRQMDESSAGRHRHVYPVIDGENNVRRFSRELGGDFVEPFARQVTPNV